ncbi:hypothetical protein [Paraconexibacter algicola]|uniref:Protein-PII uridylyltransferase N-terminal domain-containing protein n=1 Tax=Paraconexibacter algicola TaxID=2133960 RepID=A0A2T4ULL1_9ACTN|nr:hypothetical protein [Paraconexibacter algicola]PTL60110.1 hypothetical protein C7Y72_10865 [Paraconexibacter algicola]
MDADPAHGPSGALELLSERTGTPFPHLLAARALTRERLADLRPRLEDGPATSLLADQDGPREAVVLFGSWGRAELTEHSDDDWALVVDSGGEDLGERQQLLSWVGDALGTGDAVPGATGTFGEVVSAEKLAARIGLQEDTNLNLTRRMLLLLESVAVAQPEVHARAVRRVLGAYLDPTADGGDHRPPRFLLNDLVRYWRTIAVDFEGKHREPDGDGTGKWVMRNAKLRLSRKLLFAGGLVPVLRCHEHAADAMADVLVAQLAAPPTDRIADAFLAAGTQGALDTGARTLAAYDRWIGILGDGDARARLQALTRERRGDDLLWHEVRDLGERLQGGLLALLFGGRLAPVTQQYLVF